MGYFDILKSLRRERESLKKELSVPVLEVRERTANDAGYIDARYARALRVQAIDREIEATKRKAFSLIYGGKT